MSKCVRLLRNIIASNCTQICYDHTHSGKSQGNHTNSRSGKIIVKMILNWNCTSNWIFFTKNKKCHYIYKILRDWFITEVPHGSLVPYHGERVLWSTGIPNRVWDCYWKESELLDAFIRIFMSHCIFLTIIQVETGVANPHRRKAIRATLFKPLTISVIREKNFWDRVP